MWKKLGDLSIGRNFWDSVLFYLIYGTSGVFLCGVITAMVTNISSVSDTEQIKLLAFRVAPIVAGIYTFLVGGCIVWQKHLKKDALSLLCVVVGAFASMSLGLIFGFIPVAILSSLENANLSEETEEKSERMFERNEIFH